MGGCLTGSHYAYPPCFLFYMHGAGRLDGDEGLFGRQLSLVVQVVVMLMRFEGLIPHLSGC